DRLKSSASARRTHQPSRHGRGPPADVPPSRRDPGRPVLREPESPKQARSLQCSQANVGEQSTRKSKPSGTLPPPSDTHEYPVSAVLIHVQTTFLRGQRAAEVYLAL